MTAAFSEKMTDFNIFLDGIIINFDFCLDFRWSEKKYTKKQDRSGVENTFSPLLVLYISRPSIIS